MSVNMQRSIMIETRPRVMRVPGYDREERGLYCLAIACHSRPFESAAPATDCYFRWQAVAAAGERRLLRKAGEVFGKLCGHDERRLVAVVGDVGGHGHTPDIGQRVEPQWARALLLTPPTVMPSVAAASSIV